MADPGFFPTHEREGFLTKYADLDSQIQTKPPLGTLAVASYLNEKGFEVRVVDVTSESVDANGLRDILNDFRPDVVGVTSYTYRLKNAHTFIREVKQWNPSVHVCVGGPHLLIYPKETLQLEGVDSIIIGDGETPTFRLCEGIANGDKMPEATGLYHASKLDSYHAFDRNTEKNLNSLPLPEPKLINNFAGRYKNFMNEKPTMTLVSSKGCPYRCNFCIAPTIPFRVMSVERLLEAVRYYVSLGFEEIDFYDDTFNSNLKKLEKFAQGIIDEGISFHWSVRGAKVLDMSVPFLKLLKKAGLTRMQFGVETGSDKVLKALNKRLTVKETIKCFDNINAAGIESIANIMLFCPTETHEDTMQTVELIHRIKPTFISVQVFMVCPPMEWYYKDLKDGKIERDVWLDYVTNPTGEAPTLTVKGNGNCDDLFKFRDKVVMDYYLTPRYVFKRLLEMGPNEMKIHIKLGWVLGKAMLRSKLIGSG